MCVVPNQAVSEIRFGRPYAIVCLAIRPLVFHAALLVLHEHVVALWHRVRLLTADTFDQDRVGNA